MLFDYAKESVARHKLADLGLTVEQIHDTLLYGAAEKSTYTELDAPGAGEYARWSRHVRRMSETLAQQGWERINPDHQPTIVHPSFEHALVITGGNSATGLAYATPTNKNPKGRSIRNAVMGNKESVLFRPQDVQPVLGGLRQTWVLLTYVADDGRIRAEVSLPGDMVGEQITHWIHRILLPEIDPNAGLALGSEEEPPSYDFEVLRK
ncbi:conserved hypothetical protein (plasmid) [Pseudarthrobacter chlorophenolicus A6]|uniref:Uncharacterized protein n=1 Tax=Pseudarthrobacter chlorophenolicus (strain ATCC 700700 / DSM 12829 / CIP 107037 / JCM 12360 / KCTC 9906 / NCIMB 13794 / A6) TaxID=452863 RepID=B8HJF2_PSECP|nr:hypothetical protein [Pseudarthrobacter chlorophenolicus]ACL42550.1 conserved hypothetical protein [Pseudarthrobacter chlorophenolicus A6]SDQ08880.1 hypothetical protein SAMN04489738_0014 [Pseudarthrobacter chlorophenolicus]